MSLTDEEIESAFDAFKVQARDVFPDCGCLVAGSVAAFAHAIEDKLRKEMAPKFKGGDKVRVRNCGKDTWVVTSVDATPTYRLDGGNYWHSEEVLELAEEEA